MKKSKTTPTNTEGIEEQFTPGEWFFEKHNPETSKYYGNIVSLLGTESNGIKNIRTLDCLLKYASDSEMEANAHLIAASKDMYFALKELVDINSTMLAIQALEKMERFDISDRLKAALLICDSVLNKATNKQ